MSRSSRRKTNRRARFIKRIGKCEWCGSKENLTVDHKKARCFGGSNEIANWQVLCAKCNSGIKSPAENKLYAQLMMCYAPHKIKPTWITPSEKGNIGLPLSCYTDIQLIGVHAFISSLIITRPDSRKIESFKKSLETVTRIMGERGLLNEIGC